MRVVLALNYPAGVASKRAISFLLRGRKPVWALWYINRRSYPRLVRFKKPLTDWVVAGISRYVPSIDWHASSSTLRSASSHSSSAGIPGDFPSCQNLNSTQRKHRRNFLARWRSSDPQAYVRGTRLRPRSRCTRGLCVHYKLCYR